jgi:hypothetical protein
MGKTSAINLLVQAISQFEGSKGPYQKTRIQRYNPWLFAGLEALARGYLSELGRAIQDTIGDATPRKTAQFVERLVKGGAEFIGGAAALGAIALTGGTAAPLAGVVKSAVSGAISLGSHIIDSRSLDDMIEDLSEHLSSVDCRFLIVIDDLDRLQPDELRQVLTLVKTFGNLPKVTHLLAYDREIVDAALGSAPPRESGDRLPTFMEKIVQVELDLPYPTEAGLRRLMIEKLTSIFGANPEMDPEDWSLVSRVAFEHYLRSPRDIVRISNALSIVWPSVEKEVYVPDLFAIELLRHFDRAAYDVIRSQKSYMVGRGFLGDDAQQHASHSLIQSIPESRRDDVVRLLSSMFPAVSKHLSPRGSYYGGTSGILKGRRVGQPEGFDSYFRFAPPFDQIAVEKLRNISTHLQDEAYLERALRDAMDQRTPDGKSLAAPFLNAIPAILDKHDRAEPALLTVLLRLGDEIVLLKDEEADFFLMTNRMRVGSVLRILIGLVDASKLHSALMTSLEQETLAIGVAAIAIGYLAGEHGLGPFRNTDSRGPPHLSRTQVEGIAEKFTTRLGDLARQDELPVTALVDTVLSVWAAFAPTDEIRAWVARRLMEPPSFVNLVFSQMSEVSSSAAPYRYRTLRDEIDEGVFNLDELVRLAKGYLSSGAIPTDDRPDIERFVKEAEARLTAGDSRSIGPETPNGAPE